MARLVTTIERPDQRPRLCLNDERPSDLVVAALTPTAYRADRGGMGKFTHHDAEITGALRTASRKKFCHRDWSFPLTLVQQEGPGICSTQSAAQGRQGP